MNHVNINHANMNHGNMCNVMINGELAGKKKKKKKKTGLVAMVVVVQPDSDCIDEIFTLSFIEAVCDV